MHFNLFERFEVSMSTTKLNKWGNSQGVIIPKHLCEYIGLQVGDPIEITVNSKTGTIELAQKEPASVLLSAS